jgi:hypothetical protein
MKSILLIRQIEREELSMRRHPPVNNIYDQLALEGIIARIDHLSPHSTPLWGKMNAAQMLAHCSVFQSIAMGELSPARGLLGKLIGKLVSPVFYNDKPLPKNMSTIPEMIMDNEADFEREKAALKQKLKTFHLNGPERCTKHPHPFFGRLTPEQWGKGLYKHLDHHLQQFGIPSRR